jgi:hypothetical protein
MKRFLVLLIAISVFTTSFASGLSIIVPARKATEIMIPVGKSGEKISLMELTQIKVKDFEKLTGQNMKLAGKVGFKLAQKQLAKSINPDGTVNSKKLVAMMGKAKKADEKTHQYLKLWLILLGAAIVFGIIGAFVPFMWILSALAGLGAAIFFILWIISLSGGM